MADTSSRRSRVAVLTTSPASVLADYHELMNLAGYREVIAPEVDSTASDDHNYFQDPEAFLAMGGKRFRCCVKCSPHGP